MAARSAARLPAAPQQLSLVGDLGLAPPAAAAEPADPSTAAADADFDEARLSADAAARPRPRQDSALGTAAEGDPQLDEDVPTTTTPGESAAESAGPEGGEIDSDLPRWHHHSLIDPAALPPVLRHYVELKAAHPERVLLYRLGDFFEFFFEDAILLSRLLELTLTGKEAGKAVGRVPMAGIPHHAAERYCAELVRRGLSVALCDQLETTPAKGALLRRDITRVLTPGTVLEEGMLAARRNNWLCAVVLDPGGRWGLAVADVSTGEFRVTERQGGGALHQELLQVEAAEVIWPCPSEQGDQTPAWCPDGRRLTPLERTPFEAPQARGRLLARFRLASLEGLGLGEVPLAMRAAGGLLAYLDATQPGDEERAPIPLDMPTVWQAGDQLVLDAQTRRNLELTRTQLGGSLHGSLLWALDRTATAMGGRCLRRWIEAPLVDRSAILSRQGAVSELVDHRPLRLSLRRLLRPMGDLERLAGRAGAGSASARDLVALADGLERLPRLASLVRDARSAPLQALGQPWPELSALAAELRHQLVEAPPLSLSEGGLIHNGVDAVLDGLRNQLDDQDRWLAEQESLERQASGNANLRLQYHRSFGYFLAVSRARAAAVPEHWIRRQTLANEERFVTPALKGREGQILQLRARVAQREYELFVALRARVGERAAPIRTAARLVAELDALASLAEVAATSGYCRPELVAGRELRIEAGRHPVVEQLLVEEPFTANDLALGGDAGQPASPQTDLALGDGAGAPGTDGHAEQERRHGGAELAAIGNRPDTVPINPASDWPGSPAGTASRGQADPDRADGGNALSDSPDARFAPPDAQLGGTTNAPSGSAEAGFTGGDRVEAPDLLVLTGPNASGKSCYLRQSGLLQLMAQIGSWIPARSARLGIADRIFTRVGAVDDLASGQSTFMVEMAETANILHHASARSLVLLDEIGRGTATFDGLSIAWAVAEHLASSIGARTIFATHYHELNELAALLPNVGNAQVLVQETGDDLVFLHRVSRGGASRSYGIEAARLAGVPATVVLRARQVLGRIEANSHVAVGLDTEPLAVERA